MLGVTVKANNRAMFESFLDLETKYGNSVSKIYAKFDWFTSSQSPDFPSLFNEFP